MADHSKIEWTDATWNPVTGCTKVSPGCDHCYAETFSERWRGIPGHHFENGFDLTLRPERLEQPLRWRRPRRVFVNSMSDLFHDGVPDDFIARVFAVMACAPQHTFQALTKRHARMRSLLRSETFHDRVVELVAAMPERPLGLAWPLPNVWLGVSVEDQKWADIRVPALLETPAAVRFLSCEPLLGPVDLRLLDEVDGCTCGGYGPPYYIHEPECGLEPGPAFGRIHWVISGGESGPKARPAHPDWFRSLRDQCQRAGVAYYHKQNGEWLPVGPLYGDDDETDDAHMHAVMWEVDEGRQVVQLESSGHVADGHQPTDPRTWLMARVGRKAAGRELDGRTWDQFPASVVPVADPETGNHTPAGGVPDVGEVE
ncbi:MAG: phage Gp37/Gp68 family protein [Limnochordales bacterium]